MEFKVSHGTGNQYWLTVNNNPAAFAMLCENTRHSAVKDPELVAACRLVKAAPELLDALRDLDGLSWFDADPSDSEHLAAAKQQARDVLKTLEHAQ